MGDATAWLLSRATSSSMRVSGHCDPVTPFLENVSSTVGICLPTPLAFLSTLVGTLSIFSWLFAQFPQIIRNHQNKSVAGLSVFFLVEWLLGDLSNLFGAIFTNQAAWQVIIGGYYCTVDIVLVLQWIWYERLKHGRPLKRIWLPRRKDARRDEEGAISDRHCVVGDISERQHEALDRGNHIVITRTASTEPRDIPTSKATSANDMFRIPVYGTMSPSRSLACSPSNRTITRLQQQSSLPAASPRTVLLMTMLVALAARASPITSDPVELFDIPENSTAFVVGQVLSWCSTVLYLLSRLPQLVYNYRRKSTSGLSPTLFAAAFCGNLFYSTSLALNPNAWSSFGPYGGHGWADQHGSDRKEWVTAALPFFLGAAGVLGLDGAVGVQFCLYGEGRAGQEEQVLVVQERNGIKEKDLRVRKVSGWMRGWQPSASGRISPVLGTKRAPGEEREPLLDGCQPEESER